MSDKKRKGKKAVTRKTTVDKKTTLKNLCRLLAMIVTTAAVFAFYRFMMTQRYFEVVFGIYLAVATVAIIGYIIYNRGFSRKGVTKEMLPDSWSAEEKQKFIQSGEDRLRRSRPVLVLIFALCFTFVIDILELFALPMFQGMLNR